MIKTLLSFWKFQGFLGVLCQELGQRPNVYIFSVTTQHSRLTNNYDLATQTVQFIMKKMRGCTEEAGAGFSLGEVKASRRRQIPSRLLKAESSFCRERGGRDKRWVYCLGRGTQKNQWGWKQKVGFVDISSI